MAAYKTLKGQSIRQVAQDPTNPLLGEIWYNTTLGSLKGYQTISAAWASGGNLNLARRGLGSAGTQTAGLAFGGKTPPNSDATEEFDGSSWTTGGSLNDARGYLAGAGIQTSALAFGGYNNKANTEQYDGTSWSNKSDLATARESLAGAGASAGASVAFGGNTTAVQSVTEEFTPSINVITGAAWAAGGSLNTGRRNSAGAGSQTAGLVFGGTLSPSSETANSETYDGTSFSEGNNLNSARGSLLRIPTAQR